MCRIAYLKANTRIKRRDLTNLLDYLVYCNGGHGNGHAILSGPDVLECVKGVELSVDEQVDALLPALRAGHDVVWHTRLASVGVICDALCHPFQVTGKQFRGVVVHNGTWQRGSELAHEVTKRERIPCSDSLAFARNLASVSRHTLERYGSWPNSGVWLALGADAKGEAVRRLHKYSGSFAMCLGTGIFASSFPDWWPHASVPITNGEWTLSTPRTRTQAAS